MPASPDQRRDLERQIKRSPAMIVGLAECEEITAVLLQQPGEPKPAVADVPPGFEKRESYEYLTIRGCEEISLLIGLRANTGNDLSLVFWERRLEGTYKRKQRFHDAYTRVLVAKVTLDHPAPVIGRVHNVMVMHLHHDLANNNWPDRLKAFWDWLEQKLRQYNVKVLMGDFNMSLFRVIPELRSRGVVIDLAAWYPWKAKDDGEAMADSCGIFFLNAPGEYRLCRNLGHLHEDDGRGILSHVPAEQDLHAHYFDRIPRDSGPGMGLHIYLPKEN